MVVERFGAAQNFLEKFNPDMQRECCINISKSFNGSAPTIAAVRNAYGSNVSIGWVAIQLNDLNNFARMSSPDKTMDGDQIRRCAKVIESEYGELKVTELMVFFHKFKAGGFGKFYGAVDPMGITNALHDMFMPYRKAQHERFRAECDAAERERHAEGAVSYEQYKKMNGVEDAD